MGFCCPPVAADIGPAGGGSMGAPAAPQPLAGGVTHPPPSMASDQGDGLAAGTAVEEAFSVLFTNALSIGHRVEKQGSGSGLHHFPRLCPGAAQQGKAGKGRYLHNERGCQRGQEPFSRTTLLEAFWWPPPFGVHFSSKEGMV